MDDFKRRRNQIPTFGNWDYFSDGTTGTPITQCFGSVRYSCVAGDHRDLYGAAGAHDFLYSNHIPPHTYHHPLIKPPPPNFTVVSRRKTKGGVPREKLYHNNNNNRSMKDQKKHGRVHDVTRSPAEHRHHHHHSSKIPNEVERYHHHQHYITPHPQRIPPKAVDEDLYKIPPELLYKSKRKKIFGFFSCLVPTCDTA
ncbi:hypothetical protein C5167_025921 [Papaver somniferum]|uniref:Uncharacterized protein n=1 Tax=Papaver somniferum TaxID=3469 RepID=A0A4Y7JST4_PAPSO|nr:uncharacterized protein LOC113280780 [Papaver somniferum]RZC64163.1 hypothetical protein C5167_025921 [Papaver somniferum]